MDVKLKEDGMVYIHVGTFQAYPHSVIISLLGYNMTALIDMKPGMTRVLEETLSSC